ncbi:uncharacterized protein KD926_005948 [Aspergillus affinis]|uniref:uncharacterized protein n=1 Tax=Aspergillus affinis TaxID=1070780 RepID=UPI0022FE94D5|nr:uncharacterized protein KD926_005948 [Aspergillus affinis]KAI9046002.1 hypothetical protein KD926_005948 [Aspergillus affinis]
MVIELTARELIYSAIPELLTAPGSTTTDTTHKLEFKGTPVRWKSLEEDVRTVTVSDGVHWHHFPSIIAYEPSAQHAGPHHTCCEQLYCGDEHSVVARFGQNVSHAMTAVFRTLNFPGTFGDFKSCVVADLLGMVPDIVNDSSQMAVSLRECFLFLGWIIQAGHYLYNNKMSKDRWTCSMGGKFTDADQISLDDSSDCSGSSGQGSSSKRPSRASTPTHHAPSKQPSRTSASTHHAYSQHTSYTSVPAYQAPSTTQTAQRVTRSQSRARHQQDLHDPHRQQ